MIKKIMNKLIAILKKIFEPYKQEIEAIDNIDEDFKHCENYNNVDVSTTNW